MVVLKKRLLVTLIILMATLMLVACNQESNNPNTITNDHASQSQLVNRLEEADDEDNNTDLGVSSSTLEVMETTKARLIERVEAYKEIIEDDMDALNRESKALTDKSKMIEDELERLKKKMIKFSKH